MIEIASVEDPPEAIAMMLRSDGKAVMATLDPASSARVAARLHEIGLAAAGDPSTEDFSEKVRTALRTRPHQIIFFGEIKDPETAALVMDAANRGKARFNRRRASKGWRRHVRGVKAASQA